MSVKLRELKYKDLKYGLNILKHDYVVYKSVRFGIAQLALLKGTKVVKPFNHGKKLRADQAICIMVVPRGWNYLSNKQRYDTLDFKVFYSIHDCCFTYKIGKKVKPDEFNENPYEQCASGIHFFCTLKQAENY